MEHSLGPDETQGHACRGGLPKVLKRCAGLGIMAAITLYMWGGFVINLYDAVWTVLMVTGLVVGALLWSGAPLAMVFPGAHAKFMSPAERRAGIVSLLSRAEGLLWSSGVLLGAVIISNGAVNLEDPVKVGALIGYGLKPLFYAIAIKEIVVSPLKHWFIESHARTPQA